MAFEIMNAIVRCDLRIKLDEITLGDGNCFPRAVVQQCNRFEINKNLDNHKKSAAQNFMSLRNAVCKFMMETDQSCVKAFRQSYMTNEYPVDRIPWEDYWFGMNQDKVWVEYKFIQGTAWYLNHDIMLVTTGSTPENPYIYISGNIEDKNKPCSGVPLLIGSLLDSHFQSLLPTDQPPTRQYRLDFSDDEFPPLPERSFKRKFQNPSGQQTKKINANLDFQDINNSCLSVKHNRIEKQRCQNCQLRVINLETHLNTSLICKQVLTEGETLPTRIKQVGKSSGLGNRKLQSS